MRIEIKNRKFEVKDANNVFKFFTLKDEFILERKNVLEEKRKAGKIRASALKGNYTHLVKLNDSTVGGGWYECNLKQDKGNGLFGVECFTNKTGDYKSNIIVPIGKVPVKTGDVVLAYLEGKRGGDMSEFCYKGKVEADYGTKMKIRFDAGGVKYLSADNVYKFVILE